MAVATTMVAKCWGLQRFRDLRRRIVWGPKHFATRVVAKSFGPQTFRDPNITIWRPPAYSVGWGVVGGVSGWVGGRVSGAVWHTRGPETFGDHHGRQMFRATNIWRPGWLARRKHFATRVGRQCLGPRTFGDHHGREMFGDRHHGSREMFGAPKISRAWGSRTV